MVEPWTLWLPEREASEHDAPDWRRGGRCATGG